RRRAGRARRSGPAAPDASPTPEPRTANGAGPGGRSAGQPVAERVAGRDPPPHLPVIPPPPDPTLPYGERTVERNANLVRAGPVPRRPERREPHPGLARDQPERPREDDAGAERDVPHHHRHRDDAARETRDPVPRLPPELARHAPHAIHLTTVLRLRGLSSAPPRREASACRLRGRRASTTSAVRHAR